MLDAICRPHCRRSSDRPRAHPARRPSMIRRITFALAIAAIAASLAMRTTAPLVAAGAAPTITGPIASKPVGDASHDYPFYASAVDLKAKKYVEEEYFIEGVANRYNTPQLADGS